jgi:hypothetical protein
MIVVLFCRFLTRYPSKKAVFIDTAQQFKLSNLVSILSHLKEDLRLDPTWIHLPLSKLLKKQPNLEGYLDRLSIIKCFTEEEFMVTVGRLGVEPGSESFLLSILRNEPTVSLICIDTIDNFTFTESLPKTTVFNTMSMLTSSLVETRTPVICSTLLHSEFYEKLLKSMNAKSKTVPVPVKKDDETELRPDEAGNQSISAELETEEQCYTNMIIDSKYFSHSLTIVPASQAQKEAINRSEEFKNAHYATAYLVSKHKANMAGSVVNHRVKFSIFSDMLWVDVDDKQSFM